MNIDKETLSVLRLIYRKKVVTYGELMHYYPNKPIFELISVLADEKAIVYESVQKRACNGQIGPFIHNESKISCTASGKKCVEDFFEQRSRKIIEWVRYSITTAIALAAFIKSFFF